MNIRNYKELMLFICLDKTHDIYLRKEGKQYQITLNRKNWYPINKRLAKKIIGYWGIEVCK